MGLRIAITADPEIPVPPQQYGGVERIVSLLARGLYDRGHDVTLFAHKDSTAVVPRVAWRGKSSGSIVCGIVNSEVLARAHARTRFDIVHSFSRLAYLTPLMPFRVAKVMSYQRQVTPRTVRAAIKLSRGTLRLVACSRQMIPRNLCAGAWSVVYNAVSMETYKFRSSVPADAPLVFLGRIEEIKGPHLAIQIARSVNRALILAGNVAPEHLAFFDTAIKPHLNGSLVQYIGPVNDAEKNRLLGGAAALLMPILWDEPFGIVMIEALACGTPVIGFGRGAIPEVIDHGTTGFVGQNLTELIESVDHIGAIDRRLCRKAAESRFGADVMVDAYVSCYADALRRS